MLRHFCCSGIDNEVGDWGIWALTIFLSIFCFFWGIWDKTISLCLFVWRIRVRTISVCHFLVFTIFVCLFVWKIGGKTKKFAIFLFVTILVCLFFGGLGGQNTKCLLFLNHFLHYHIIFKRAGIVFENYISFLHCFTSQLKIENEQVVKGISSKSVKLLSSPAFKRPLLCLLSRWREMVESVQASHCKARGGRREVAPTGIRPHPPQTRPPLH